MIFAPYSVESRRLLNNAFRRNACTLTPEALFPKGDWCDDAAPKPPHNISEWPIPPDAVVSFCFFWGRWRITQGRQGRAQFVTRKRSAGTLQGNHERSEIPASPQKTNAVLVFGTAFVFVMLELCLFFWLTFLFVYVALLGISRGVVNVVAID